MEQIAVYGIKNCDTMKKALRWLDSHKIAYVFHDYKKAGADAKIVKHAVALLGWENVLNRKGTTWRALPDKLKDAMDDKKALNTALENPSVIRRPLIVRGQTIYAGFDESDYQRMFASSPSQNYNSD